MIAAPAPAPLVKKVQGLIALAASDHLEEARTSAYLACRLIRDRGLHVVAELPRVAPPPPPPPPPPWQAPRKPDYHCSDAPKPRTITSRYDSVCRDCGAQILIGDSVIWIRGRGVWHPECAP